MAATQNDKASDQIPNITERDILFECPSCNKSLVVEEHAAGMTVPCPQCGISVIVPPKPTFASGAPPAPPPATTGPMPPRVPPAPAPPRRAAPPAAAASPALGAGGDLRLQLLALGTRLQELQAQRTELNTRLASRLNEVTRDLVLLARQETSHQQLLTEWHELVEKLKPAETIGSAVPNLAIPATGSAAPKPAV